MTNAEKAHRLAYRFLCVLSDHLKRGTIHLRDKNGQLLQTLDEVTLAVKDGRWPAESQKDELRIMNEQERSSL